MSSNNSGCLPFAFSALILASLPSFVGLAYYAQRQESKRDAIEQRGYLVPQRFQNPELVDLDCDGKLETIVKYKDKTFLAAVGTNGIPYFVPYKVEIK